MKDFTKHFNIEWFYKDIWQPIMKLHRLHGLSDTIQLTRERFILENISNHTDVQSPGIFSTKNKKNNKKYEDEFSSADKVNHVVKIGSSANSLKTKHCPLVKINRRTKF